MSHSLAKIIIHLIFSTKSRIPFITETIKISLYQYMSSIAKSYGSDVYEIGGVEDHVHMLINLPRTLTLSKLVEEIKKSSSKWIKTKGNDYYDFAWQHGYGAFSISQSNFDNVKCYIQNQQEHHKKMSFKEEYELFLKKYQIDYKNEYLWE